MARSDHIWFSIVLNNLKNFVQSIELTKFKFSKNDESWNNKVAGSFFPIHTILSFFASKKKIL